LNQASIIPFGTDATKVAGYAFATARLGNVDLVFENTGDNTLSAKCSQFVSGNPSSYVQIVPWFTVVPGGTVTKSLCLPGVSAPGPQIAFFGSGRTTANISVVARNPANLRGIEVSIVPIGRFGWGFDTAFDQGSFLPTWPSLPNDGP
jgi:hypothetical protein